VTRPPPGPVLRSSNSRAGERWIDVGWRRDAIATANEVNLPIRPQGRRGPPCMWIDVGWCRDAIARGMM